MFNMLGHSISFRGPRSDDEVGGVDTSTLAMVIVGEDMGELVLAAFNLDGEVVYRAPEVDRVVLSNYIAAGRTVVSAMEREQKAAVVDAAEGESRR